MKTFNLVLIALFLLTACEQAETLPLAIQKEPLLVVAHRGVLDSNSPENSLLEMDKAFEKGIRFFEIDIRENEEGKLYLLHDESLDRTTTGRGLLKNFSQESLEGIFIKGTQEQIPTFSAALDWAKKRGVWLMLDAKVAPLESILREVQSAKMEEQVLLLTFTRERAAEALELNGNFLVSVLIPDEESLRYYGNQYDKGRLVAYIPKASAPNWFIRVKSMGLATLSDVMGEVDARAQSMGKEIYTRFQESRNLDMVVTDFPLLW